LVRETFERKLTRATLRLPGHTQYFKKGTANKGSGFSVEQPRKDSRGGGLIRKGGKRQRKRFLLPQFGHFGDTRGEETVLVESTRKTEGDTNNHKGR